MARYASLLRLLLDGMKDRHRDRPECERSVTLEPAALGSPASIQLPAKGVEFDSAVDAGSIALTVYVEPAISHLLHGYEKAALPQRLSVKKRSCMYRDLLLRFPFLKN